MKRIVIFTVGYHARTACRALRRRPDCRVVGFVDNNPLVVGGSRLGLPVFSPEALGTLDFDLVAVPGRHQDAITAQLCGPLGVEPGRIWRVRKSEVLPTAGELERKAADLAALLRRTVGILDAAGIRYWAMHSTLLGLIRGDDLASFTDLDLCVEAAGFDALEPHFREGFNLQAVAPADGGARAADGPASRLAQLSMRATPLVPDEEPAIVDLHSVSLGSTEAVWWVEGRTVQLPAAVFRGRDRREYRGVPVPIPAEPEAILQRLYGPGWRTPVETWNGRYLATPPSPVSPVI